MGLGFSSTDCLKKCFIERMKKKSEGYTSENTNELICSKECLAVPGYSSNLVFELYKTEKNPKTPENPEKVEYDYSLRVVLNGYGLPFCENETDPKKPKSTFCPYDKSKQLFLTKFVYNNEKEFHDACFGV